MRQGPNGRRPRGRPNRKQHGGPSRPNSYDSGGPEGRIRGNAHQVYEKYVGLARDAISAGDRVVAEAYFQHAEHYFRIVNSSTDPVTAKPPVPQSADNGRDGDTREPNGADGRDHRSSDRESGAGRQDRTPRGQDARRDDSTRNANERSPARNAPSDNAQSAAAPQRAVEDREGLDRVLSKEGAESPQAESNGSPDREAGQASTRRRSRQRPARSQDAEDGSGRQDRPADRSDNGEASEAAPVQQEATETSAPREKDQDTEPAGA